MIRHPPECFDNHHHKLLPYGAEHCPKQGQIFHAALGWINYPFEDCNLSDADLWCYTHRSDDCARLESTWMRAVQLDNPQALWRKDVDKEALRACALTMAQLAKIAAIYHEPDWV